MELTLAQVLQGALKESHLEAISSPGEIILTEELMKELQSLNWSTSKKTGNRFARIRLENGVMYKLGTSLSDIADATTCSPMPDKNMYGKSTMAWVQ